jgi:hypothetical protein
MGRATTNNETRSGVDGLVEIKSDRMLEKAEDLEAIPECTT